MFYFVFVPSHIYKESLDGKWYSKFVIFSNLDKNGNVQCSQRITKIESSRPNLLLTVPRRCFCFVYSYCYCPPAFC